MVEGAPQKKQGEQHPLLKVDSGGGDGNINPQTPITVVTSAWGVSSTTKPSWLIRWPEYLSACWMTFILLGISFLVFYTLAMESYRRQPMAMKCNGSKPASDVFYHQIVQRDSPAPFMLYSEYLSNIAVQYPYLHFHVIFLIDDTLQVTIRGPRHNRFINKLIPYSPYPMSRMDENNKRELRDFRKKYQNVNITIAPLSKYMAMTPLKYKWRAIPLAFIPFYARIFSVWQSGGIGMDLSTFNNNYNNRQFVDRRVSTILKQHNDGIKPEDYANALNKIDREEENEFISIFIGLMHQVLNETRSFLSKNFPFPQITTEKESHDETLVRTHRNKRDVSEPATDKNIQVENSTVYVETLNSTNETDIKRNEYKTVSGSELNLTELLVTNKINPERGNVSVTKDHILPVINKSQALETMNKSEIPRVVLFYDFSVFSDGLAPLYPSPEALLQPSLKSSVAKNPELYKAAKHGNTVSQMLSIDSEGMFVAASTRLHPFLGYLIPSGCQRMPPKLAIQDALLTQCSGIFKEEPYCNNIYLL